MCQYQSDCPTTRHRPGTQCPVRVGIQNHNRKVEAERLQTLWGIVVLVVILGVGFAAYWFLFRDGATGIGVPAIDELVNITPGLVSHAPAWIRWAA